MPVSLLTNLLKVKITIALDNVPFNTAIKLITSAKGLAYRMVDGVILLPPRKIWTSSTRCQYVFKLNYAKAEDVKNALNDILESEKKISIDPITNSILFSGKKTQMKSVRSAIKAMDVATKQITWKPRSTLSNRKKTVKTWASTGIGIRYHRTKWDKQQRQE